MSDLSFLKEIPDPVPLAEAGATVPAPPPAEASPDRSETTRRRVAALVVSLVWLGVHLFMFGIRQDFSRLPPAYIAAQVLVPALFGAGCLTIALAPGKLGLGLGIGWVAGMAFIGPVSFWALALSLPAPHQAAGAGDFWLGSLRCLTITLAWAAAPLVVVALSLRRAFPSQAMWRSALVGAALGLLSGAAINLHCVNANAWHLLVGHGVPVALAALLGGLLVVRWTRV